ncbi:MFS transporter [ANME-1 cluster archaeon AG-394-G06]|nr:MFS transporter [ANME-1 cluster archaeon AG-394-G06]
MREAMEKRTLFTLYFSIVAALLGLSIISPLLPTIAEDLGATGFWVGMIFSGYAISRAIIMPIMGGLSDKYGRKILIASGLLLLAVISLLYLLAHNVYTLTAVRLLHGLAAGMIIPVAMAYAGETAKEGKEGRAMGIINMMFYLGVAVGPLIGGIFWHAFGMASVFYVMSGISVFVLLLVLSFLPEIKNSKASKIVEHDPFKTLIKRDAVKIILLIALITAFRTGVLLSFLPSHASDFNINAAQVGIILSVGVIFTGILQPCFGIVADKLSKYNMLLQIVIGSFVGTIVLFMVPLCHDFTTLLLVNVFIGLGAAISMPVATDIAVVIGKKVGIGSWMGIFNTTISLGIIIAPLMSGVVMDCSGINSVFYYAGIVSLLCTLIGCYYVWRWSKGQ